VSSAAPACRIGGNQLEEGIVTKRQISTDNLRQPSGHFSQATVIEARGRLVFVSGMTARRADGTIAGVGDVEAQTRQVLENVKAAMAAAGGTLDDVCRVDVYIRNMEHFDVIHKVRREYFKPPLPASTMVEVTKMVSPDYLIEISAIGVIADD
jgi:2-iminobutanoate/2-iminopropanoate deaminase